MDLYLTQLVIVNISLVYYLVKVSLLLETDGVDIICLGFLHTVRHQVVLKVPHKLHSTVLVLGFLIMSLVTLFLHLFQHRMLALIYSHALTSIVATLKSFLEYSCFIPRLSSDFRSEERRVGIECRSRTRP